MSFSVSGSISYIHTAIFRTDRFYWQIYQTPRIVRCSACALYAATAPFNKVIASKFDFPIQYLNI